MQNIYTKLLGKLRNIIDNNNCGYLCLSSCVSWVGYEGAQFTDNMYVLEEGEYPDTEAMGFLSSTSNIRSMQTTGHVSTVNTYVHMFIHVSCVCDAHSASVS